MRQTILPAICALSAILAFSITSASAETIATTRYVYYPISGRTAAELYNAMIKRGPHVDGDEAYAATSATTSQQGQLVSGKSCHIQNYAVKMDFTIRLPRLQKSPLLSAADRKRYDQFSAFLRHHEETHRSIWLDCAAAVAAKQSKLTGKSCAAVEAKSEQLWINMRKSCSLKHQAFDAKEHQRLLQQPLVRYVLGKGNKSTKGAKAP